MIRIRTMLLAAPALAALSGCEAEIARGTQAQPAAYPSPYGPMPAPGWPHPPQPMPMPVAQAFAAPEPAPGDTRPPRAVDTSLDSASSFRLPPSQDVRDPWERDVPRAREPVTAAAPSAPELPKTYLLVVIDLDDKAAPAARWEAAKALLASRGGLKRAEATWEIPVFAEDRSPYRLAGDLQKTLCNEDRAALFFLAEGQLVKLEVAGESACEKARRK